MEGTTWNKYGGDGRIILKWVLNFVLAWTEFVSSWHCLTTLVIGCVSRMRLLLSSWLVFQ